MTDEELASLVEDANTYTMVHSPRVLSALAEAALAEREACAKAMDGLFVKYDARQFLTAAKTIRSRTATQAEGKCACDRYEYCDACWPPEKRATAAPQPPASRSQEGGMREALEKARSLLSYASQDSVGPVHAEANRNAAWHVLDYALAHDGGMREAATDVLAERERQKSVEGWTENHDDCHHLGEMAGAAAAYARNAGLERIQPPPYWPWHPRWWKPKDRRRDLVRAGALIIAEIERLDRAALAHDGGRGREEG
jgi:hypothetical protein